MHTERMKRGRSLPLIPTCVACVIVMFGCPPRQNVTLDEASSTNGIIGPEGGTITSTAGNGIEYTLDVPADALAEPVDITITPVTGIANLPLSGGMAGAVELAPAGLAFARPATLTIEGAAAPPAGQIAIGFGFEGDASSFEVALANADNGRLTVLVQHFSGSGVGFGTLQDVSGMPGGAFCAGTALESAAITLAITPHQAQDETAYFRTAFTSCILPQLQNATNDAELVRAVSNYEAWAIGLSITLGFTVSPATSPDFAAEREQAAQAAAEQLRTAILGNNQLCRSNASLSALANVLFWQKQAALFGVDTPQEQLDLVSVIGSLCARVVLVNSNLPASMQVGFPHSLDLTFAVRFDDGTEIPADFEVTLAGSDNVNIENPIGFTGNGGSQSPAGFYTTVVTATAAGPISIPLSACLVLPGTVTPTPLCGIDVIDSNGLDISGTYTGFISYSNASFSDHFDNTLILTQNQNAISGSYEGTSSSGGLLISGTITGTLAMTGNGLSGVQLLGFEATQLTPCAASMGSSAPVDFFVFPFAHPGFQVDFNIDDISGCPGCYGPPESRACATKVKFVFNKM